MLPERDWLVKAINWRLREEFAKLHVAINENKSPMVDLKRMLTLRSRDGDRDKSLRIKQVCDVAGVFCA